MTTNTTTGERIAQKRRETALSQEQLGAEMGVSRQAIYKWESGAALPEIENLVQLAKRFDVSIGWLLGLEESEAKGDNELTEVQLKMVEEIAERYRPTVTKRKKWLVLGGAAAVLIALAVLFTSLFHRLSTLQKDNADLNNNVLSLQGSVYNVQSGVQAQIDQITGEVKEALEQQTMLTSSYTCDIKTYDLKKNTITFSVTASPKVAHEGTRAVFTAVSGEETVEQEGRGNGQLYRAELTCPLSDQIGVSVSFFHDDQQENQLLERYEHLYSDTLPCWFFDGDLFYTEVVDTLPAGVLSRIYQVFDSHTLAAAKVSSLRVGVFRDNKLLQWLTPFEELTDQQKENLVKDNPIDYHQSTEHATFMLTEDVPLSSKGDYAIVIVITDEAGRTTCYPGITIDRNGEYWELNLKADFPTASKGENWGF